MDERRYSITDGLLYKIIEAFKAGTIAYHGVARNLTAGQQSRLRVVADKGEEMAEEIKRQMREQDGAE